MIAVKTQGLEKTYELGKVKVQALKGVDIEVNKGEFVAITGASGSGKTTLLNLIGLLDRPTRGKVLLWDVDTSHLTESERARMRLRGIGFVFQFFNLFDELRAIENVMLPMVLFGKKDARKRARELLSTVGLKNLELRYPSELSGGEQQRVAIARALANEPDLLLADEPTGNLDSGTALSLVELFREISQNLGVTILMVTHEIELVSRADRVIKLKDGLVVESGQ